MEQVIYHLYSYAQLVDLGIDRVQY